MAGPPAGLGVRNSFSVILWIGRVGILEFAPLYGGVGLSCQLAAPGRPDSERQFGAKPL